MSSLSDSRVRRRGGKLSLAGVAWPLAGALAAVIFGLLAVVAPAKLVVALAAAAALIVLLDDERTSGFVLLIAIFGRVVTDSMGVSSAPNAISGNSLNVAVTTTSSPYTGYFDGLFLLVGLAVAVRRGVSWRAVGLIALLAFGFFNATQHFPLDNALSKEFERSLGVMAVYIGARGMNVGVRSLRSLCKVLSVIPLYGVLQIGLHPSIRSHSFLSHPNSAASILAGLLVACIWLRWFSDEGFDARWVLLYAVGLVATRSFGGLIAAVVGIVVLAGFNARLQRRSIIPLLVSLVLLGLFYAESPIGSARVAELAQTTSPSQALSGDVTNSLDWRFRQWQILVDVGLKQPWLGYGLGTTSSDVDPDGELPHSDFVRLFVEFGVVGLVAVGGLLWWLIATRLRAWRLEADRGAALQAAVLVVVIANGIASNEFTYTPTMVTALYIYACGRGISRSRPVQTELQCSPVGARRRRTVELR
jgi:predicted secreted protein